MKRRVSGFVIASGAAAILLPAVALAQVGVPDPLVDLGAFFALANELWQGARWAPLIALAVVGVVAVLRRYGAAWIPWFGTKVGGLTLAGLTAFTGAVASTLLESGPVNWAYVLFTAILAAVGAVGVHSGVKNAAQAVRGQNEPSSPKATTT